MADTPTSPKQGVPKHRTRPSEQLHNRAMSTSTRIVMPAEPHTPPRESRRNTGAVSGGQYRSIPESPTVRNGGSARTTIPSTPTRRRKTSGRGRSYAGGGNAHDWIEDRATKRSTVRRLLVWTAVAASALLIFAAFHQTGISSVSAGLDTDDQPAEEHTLTAIRAKAALERQRVEHLAPKKPVYRPDHLPKPAIVPHEPDNIQEASVETNFAPVKPPPSRYLLVAWMGEQETKVST